jgi:hypothetical protein
MSVTDDLRRALEQPSFLDFIALARNCIEKAQHAIDNDKPIIARDWIDAAQTALATARELGQDT